MTEDDDEFEVEISPPSYALMAKAPVIEDAIEPALREITAVLQSKSDMYHKRLLEVLERLEDAFKGLDDADTTKQSLKMLRQLTHNLKGEGGTFDYPMISGICQTFCSFIEDLAAVEEFELAVIRLHIDSIRMVVTENMRGDVGEEGTAILSGLQEVVEHRS